MEYNIIKDTKLMKEFLQENNHSMLMYDDGAGGEFLIYLASKFSKDFATLQIKTDESINRTILLFPTIFNVMSFIVSHVDPAETALEHFYKENKNIKKPLLEYINEIKQEYNPTRFLLRSHYQSDNPFNGEKYVIQLTSKLHITYVDILRHIKITLRPILVEGNKIRLYTMDRFARHCKNKEDADKALALARSVFEYLHNQKLDYLKNIYEGHLSMISVLINENYDINFSSLIDVFSKTPDELFKQFHNGGNFKWTQHIDGVTVINYSDIFVPGYLEELFNIENTQEFRNELNSWHNKNLMLVQQHGFDSEMFRNL